MPAKSKKQQMVAGTALGAKRGKRFEVVAQEGFAGHLQVDGQSRAAQNGEDQAQGKADTQTQEEVALTLQVALLARHPIAPPSEQMRR
jgi:hypothetical protein